MDVQQNVCMCVVGLCFPKGSNWLEPSGEGSLYVYLVPKSKFSSFWTWPISLICAVCLDPRLPLPLKTRHYSNTTIKVLSLSNSSSLLLPPEWFSITPIENNCNWSHHTDLKHLATSDSFQIRSSFSVGHMRIFITWILFMHHFPLPPHYPFSSHLTCPLQFP